MKRMSTYETLTISSLRRRSRLLTKLSILLILIALFVYFALFDGANNLDEVIENGTDATDEAAETQTEEMQIDIEMVLDIVAERQRRSRVSGNVSGEMGRPYVLPTDLPDEVKKRIQTGWDIFGYNQYVSDRISVNRSLPDMRPEGCRTETYSDDLPKASVIICFYNEAWSVLLRTIHSVLNRSPQHLLEEIILVDDNSNMTHLGHPLDDYVRKLDKVNLIRTNETGGLLRARQLGATVAKGPVLIFLYSHCECTTGWLEPLLKRIHDNSTIAVCPFLDDVDGDTFEYIHFLYPDILFGGFDWNLEFRRFATDNDTKREMRENTWDPIWTPAMSGHVFAIDKNFFQQLGGFDVEFEPGEGGELELSFRIWMCGGALEIVPCSNVGLLVQEHRGYLLDVQKNSIRNRARVAEMWLDEYKWTFYADLDSNTVDFGHVKPRNELRSRLNCKSFDWYLKNVYAEQTIPDLPVAFGEIRSLAFEKDACIDGSQHVNADTMALNLYPCNKKSGDQHWELLKTRHIRLRWSVWCIDDPRSGGVILFECHEVKNQEWFLDVKTNSIRNLQTNACLSVSKDKTRLQMEPCTGGVLQQWKFGTRVQFEVINFTEESAQFENTTQGLQLPRFS